MGARVAARPSAVETSVKEKWLKPCFQRAAAHAERCSEEQQLGDRAGTGGGQGVPMSPLLISDSGVQRPPATSGLLGWGSPLLLQSPWPPAFSLLQGSDVTSPPLHTGKSASGLDNPPTPPKKKASPQPRLGRLDLSHKQAGAKISSSSRPWASKGQPEGRQPRHEVPPHM